MLDADLTVQCERGELPYDSVLVRELALFACNDEKLYRNYNEGIYRDAAEAYRKGRFAWSEFFRRYYNTIPQITRRYQVLYDWIGKRMTLLERHMLAKEITEYCLSDIQTEGELPDGKHCEENRSGNAACIGKMLDSGQLTLFT